MPKPGDRIASLLVVLLMVGSAIPLATNVQAEPETPPSINYNTTQENENNLPIPIQETPSKELKQVWGEELAAKIRDPGLASEIAMATQENMKYMRPIIIVLRNQPPIKKFRQAWTGTDKMAYRAALKKWLRSQIEDEQQAIVDKIHRNGGYIYNTYTYLNAIAAKLPIDKIQEIAQDPRVLTIEAVKQYHPWQNGEEVPPPEEITLKPRQVGTPTTAEPEAEELGETAEPYVFQPPNQPLLADPPKELTLEQKMKLRKVAEEFYRRLLPPELFMKWKAGLLTHEELMQELKEYREKVSTYSGREVVDMGVAKAYAEGYDGSGVIVGVVDTGIDVTHPALKDRVIEAADFSWSTDFAVMGMATERRPYTWKIEVTPEAMAEPYATPEEIGIYTPQIIGFQLFWNILGGDIIEQEVPWIGEPNELTLEFIGPEGTPLHDPEVVKAYIFRHLPGAPGGACMLIYGENYTESDYRVKYDGRHINVFAYSAWVRVGDPATKLQYLYVGIPICDDDELGISREDFFGEWTIKIIGSKVVARGWQDAGEYIGEPFYIENFDYYWLYLGTKAVHYNHRNDPSDYHGHGTASASVITASPAGGRQMLKSFAGGMAPGAKILSAKTDFSTYSLMAAEEWMFDKGADVVNNSWGSIDGLADGTSVLSMQASRLVEAGMIYVAAAGNAGPGINSIGTPSDGVGVISVGAAYHPSEVVPIAFYSSTGPTTDGRIKPTVVGITNVLACAVAERDTIQGRLGRYHDDPGYYYTYHSGTSAAAPTVVGALATLIQAYKDKYGTSVVDPEIMGLLITQTAKDLGVSHLRQGAGLVQVDKALELLRTEQPNPWVTPLTVRNNRTGVEVPAYEVQGWYANREPRGDGQLYPADPLDPPSKTFTIINDPYRHGEYWENGLPINKIHFSADTVGRYESLSVTLTEPVWKDDFAFKNSGTSMYPGRIPPEFKTAIGGEVDNKLVNISKKYYYQKYQEKNVKYPITEEFEHISRQSQEWARFLGPDHVVIDNKDLGVIPEGGEKSFTVRLSGKDIHTLIFDGVAEVGDKKVTPQDLPIIGGYGGLPTLPEYYNYYVYSWHVPGNANSMQIILDWEAPEKYEPDYPDLDMIIYHPAYVRGTSRASFVLIKSWARSVIIPFNMGYPVNASGADCVPGNEPECEGTPGCAECPGAPFRQGGPGVFCDVTPYGDVNLLWDCPTCRMPSPSLSFKHPRVGDIGRPEIVDIHFRSPIYPAMELDYSAAPLSIGDQGLWKALILVASELKRPVPFTLRVDISSIYPNQPDSLYTSTITAAGRRPKSEVLQLAMEATPYIETPMAQKDRDRDGYLDIVRAGEITYGRGLKVPVDGGKPIPCYGIDGFYFLGKFKGYDVLLIDTTNDNIVNYNVMYIDWDKDGEFEHFETVLGRPVPGKFHEGDTFVYAGMIYMVNTIAKDGSGVGLSVKSTQLVGLARTDIIWNLPPNAGNTYKYWSSDIDNDQDGFINEDPEAGVDTDGDGLVDEDPVNYLDDDGDGLVDEDTANDDDDVLTDEDDVDGFTLSRDPFAFIILERDVDQDMNGVLDNNPEFMGLLPETSVDGLLEEDVVLGKPSDDVRLSQPQLITVTKWWLTLQGQPNDENTVDSIVREMPWVNQWTPGRIGRSVYHVGHVELSVGADNTGDGINDQLCNKKYHVLVLYRGDVPEWEVPKDLHDKYELYNMVILDEDGDFQTMDDQILLGDFSLQHYTTVIRGTGEPPKISIKQLEISGQTRPCDKGVVDIKEITRPIYPGIRVWYDSNGNGRFDSRDYYRFYEMDMDPRGRWVKFKPVEMSYDIIAGDVVDVSENIQNGTTPTYHVVLVNSDETNDKVMVYDAAYFDEDGDFLTTHDQYGPIHPGETFTNGVEYLIPPAKTWLADTKGYELQEWSNIPYEKIVKLGKTATFDVHIEAGPLPAELDPTIGRKIPPAGVEDAIRELPSKSGEYMVGAAYVPTYEKGVPTSRLLVICIVDTMRAGEYDKVYIALADHLEFTTYYSVGDTIQVEDLTYIINRIDVNGRFIDLYAEIPIEEPTPPHTGVVELRKNDFWKIIVLNLKDVDDEKDVHGRILTPKYDTVYLDKDGDFATTDDQIGPLSFIPPGETTFKLGGETTATGIEPEHTYYLTWIAEDGMEVGILRDGSITPDGKLWIEWHHYETNPVGDIVAGEPMLDIPIVYTVPFNVFSYDTLFQVGGMTAAGELESKLAVPPHGVNLMSKSGVYLVNTTVVTLWGMAALAGALTAVPTVNFNYFNMLEGTKREWNYVWMCLVDPEEPGWYTHVYISTEEDFYEVDVDKNGRISADEIYTGVDFTDDGPYRVGDVFYVDGKLYRIKEIWPAAWGDDVDGPGPDGMPWIVTVTTLDTTPAAQIRETFDPSEEYNRTEYVKRHFFYVPPGVTTLTIWLSRRGTTRTDALLFVYNPRGIDIHGSTNTPIPVTGAETFSEPAPGIYEAIVYMPPRDVTAAVQYDLNIQITKVQVHPTNIEYEVPKGGRVDYHWNEEDNTPGSTLIFLNRGVTLVDARVQVTGFGPRYVETGTVSGFKPVYHEFSIPWDTYALYLQLEAANPYDNFLYMCLEFWNDFFWVTLACTYYNPYIHQSVIGMGRPAKIWIPYDFIDGLKHHYGMRGDAKYRVVIAADRDIMTASGLTGYRLTRVIIPWKAPRNEDANWVGEEIDGVWVPTGKVVGRNMQGTEVGEFLGRISSGEAFYVDLSIEVPNRHYIHYGEYMGFVHILAQGMPEPLAPAAMTEAPFWTPIYVAERWNMVKLVPIMLKVVPKIKSYTESIDVSLAPGDSVTRVIMIENMTNTSIEIPKINNDEYNPCEPYTDAAVDEDPIDFIDNDNDGRVDEDPPELGPTDGIIVQDRIDQNGQVWRYILEDKNGRSLIDETVEGIEVELDYVATTPTYWTLALEYFDPIERRWRTAYDFRDEPAASMAYMPYGGTHHRWGIVRVDQPDPSLRWAIKVEGMWNFPQVDLGPDGQGIPFTIKYRLLPWADPSWFTVTPDQIKLSPFDDAPIRVTINPPADGPKPGEVYHGAIMGINGDMVDPDHDDYDLVYYELSHYQPGVGWITRWIPKYKQLPHSIYYGNWKPVSLITYRNAPNGRVPTCPTTNARYVHMSDWDRWFQVPVTIRITSNPRRRAITWIMENQNWDGSWTVHPDEVVGRVDQTCYAIQAILDGIDGTDTIVDYVNGRKFEGLDPLQDFPTNYKEYELHVRYAGNIRIELSWPDKYINAYDLVVMDPAGNYWRHGQGWSNPEVVEIPSPWYPQRSTASPPGPTWSVISNKSMSGVYRVRVYAVEPPFENYEFTLKAEGGIFRLPNISRDTEFILRRAELWLKEAMADDTVPIHPRGWEQLRVPARGWGKRSGSLPETKETSLAILTLLKLGYSPNDGIIRSAIRWLILNQYGMFDDIPDTIQLEEGGWGRSQRIDGSWPTKTEYTALATKALIEYLKAGGDPLFRLDLYYINAREPYQTIWVNIRRTTLPKAIIWLLRHQQENGDWIGPDVSPYERSYENAVLWPGIPLWAEHDKECAGGLTTGTSEGETSSIPKQETGYHSLAEGLDLGEYVTTPKPVIPLKRSPAQKLGPNLVKRLMNASPEESIDVIITLEDQPVIGDQAYKQALSETGEALKKYAEKTQAPLRNALLKMGIPEEKIQSFWIVNAIRAPVPADRIWQLAQRHDVAHIWYNTVSKPPIYDSLQQLEVRGGTSIPSYGVWRKGVTGGYVDTDNDGVIETGTYHETRTRVALLDTGVGTRYILADNDGIDNDDDGVIDEPGEVAFTGKIVEKDLDDKWFGLAVDAEGCPVEPKVIDIFDIEEDAGIPPEVHLFEEKYDYDDHADHGTHIAGIIAGTGDCLDSQRYRGAAGEDLIQDRDEITRYGAQILNVKIYRYNPDEKIDYDNDGDGLYDEDWVDCIDNDQDGEVDEDPPIYTTSIADTLLGMQAAYEAEPHIMVIETQFPIFRTELTGYDDDGDGMADEDELDGIDNDFDGLTDEDPSVYGTTGTDPVSLAADQAFRSGIFVVAPVGNYGLIEGENSVASPAASKYTLAVGATHKLWEQQTIEIPITECGYTRQWNNPFTVECTNEMSTYLTTYWALRGIPGVTNPPYSNNGTYCINPEPVDDLWCGYAIEDPTGATTRIFIDGEWREVPLLWPQPYYVQLDSDGDGRLSEDPVNGIDDDGDGEIDEDDVENIPLWVIVVDPEIPGVYTQVWISWGLDEQYLSHLDWCDLSTGEGMDPVGPDGPYEVGDEIEIYGVRFQIKEIAVGVDPETGLPIEDPKVVLVGRGNRVHVEKRWLPSSYGPTTDGRVKPEVVAPGVAILSPKPCATAEDCEYSYVTGTSAAAGMVAGVGALLHQAYRYEYKHMPPPIVLRTALMQHAVDLADPGIDNKTGWGRIQAWHALNHIIQTEDKIVATNLAVQALIEFQELIELYNKMACRECGVVTNHGAELINAIEALITPTRPMAQYTYPEIPEVQDGRKPISDYDQYNTFDLVTGRIRDHIKKAIRLGVKWLVQAQHVGHGAPRNWAMSEKHDNDGDGLYDEDQIDSYDNDFDLRRDEDWTNDDYDYDELGGPRIDEEGQLPDGIDNDEDGLIDEDLGDNYNNDNDYDAFDIDADGNTTETLTNEDPLDGIDNDGDAGDEDLDALYNEDPIDGVDNDRDGKIDEDWGGIDEDTTILPQHIDYVSRDGVPINNDQDRWYDEDSPESINNDPYPVGRDREVDEDHDWSIDNDEDGLYDEDWPDGIDNDGDWTLEDDMNWNYVPDPEEPHVDEDPIEIPDGSWAAGEFTTAQTVETLVKAGKIDPVIDTWLLGQKITPGTNPRSDVVLRAMTWLVEQQTEHGSWNDHRTPRVHITEGVTEATAKAIQALIATDYINTFEVEVYPESLTPGEFTDITVRVRRKKPEHTLTTDPDSPPIQGAKVWIQAPGLYRIYPEKPKWNDLVTVRSRTRHTFTGWATTDYDREETPLVETILGIPINNDDDYVGGVPRVDEDSRDDDGDGLIDEDPLDGEDNDGDEAIDEDPGEAINNDGDTRIVYYDGVPVDTGIPLYNEDPIDGIDNDGDGAIDEDWPDVIDDDGDGYFNEDTNVDGVDQDGDGLDGEDPTHGRDNDLDGYVDEDGPETGDDDYDGKVNEDPIDGIDNDGDGLVDEDPTGRLTITLDDPDNPDNPQTWMEVFLDYDIPMLDLDGDGIEEHVPYEEADLDLYVIRTREEIDYIHIEQLSDLRQDPRDRTGQLIGRSYYVQRVPDPPERFLLNQSPHLSEGKYWFFIHVKALPRADAETAQIPWRIDVRLNTSLRRPIPPEYTDVNGEATFKHVRIWSVDSDGDGKLDEDPRGSGRDNDRDTLYGEDGLDITNIPRQRIRAVVTYNPQALIGTDGEIIGNGIDDTEDIILDPYHDVVTGPDDIRAIRQSVLTSFHRYNGTYVDVAWEGGDSYYYSGNRLPPTPVVTEAQPPAWWVETANPDPDAFPEETVRRTTVGHMMEGGPRWMVTRFEPFNQPIAYVRPSTLEVTAAPRILQPGVRQTFKVHVLNREEKRPVTRAIVTIPSNGYEVPGEVNFDNEVWCPFGPRFADPMAGVGGAVGGPIPRDWDGYNIKTAIAFPIESYLVHHYRLQVPAGSEEVRVRMWWHPSDNPELGEERRETVIAESLADVDVYIAPQGEGWYSGYSLNLFATFTRSTNNQPRAPPYEELIIKPVVPGYAYDLVLFAPFDNPLSYDYMARYRGLIYYMTFEAKGPYWQWTDMNGEARFEFTPLYGGPMGTSVMKNEIYTKTPQYYTYYRREEIEAIGVFDTVIVWPEQLPVKGEAEGRAQLAKRDKYTGTTVVNVGDRHTGEPVEGVFVKWDNVDTLKTNSNGEAIFYVNYKFEKVDHSIERISIRKPGYGGLKRTEIIEMNRYVDMETQKGAKKLYIVEEDEREYYLPGVPEGRSKSGKYIVHKTHPKEENRKHYTSAGAPELITPVIINNQPVYIVLVDNEVAGVYDEAWLALPSQTDPSPAILFEGPYFEGSQLKIGGETFTIEYIAENGERIILSGETAPTITYTITAYRDWETVVDLSPYYDAKDEVYEISVTYHRTLKVDDDNDGRVDEDPENDFDDDADGEVDEDGREVDIYSLPIPDVAGAQVTELRAHLKWYNPIVDLKVFLLSPEDEPIGRGIFTQATRIDEQIVLFTNATAHTPKPGMWHAEVKYLVAPPDEEAFRMAEYVLEVTMLVKRTFVAEIEDLLKQPPVIPHWYINYEPVDKFEASAEINRWLLKKFWLTRSPEQVIVVRDDITTDAAVVAPFAAIDGQRTPIVVVKTDQVPEQSKEILAKTRAREAIIIGGEKAISKNIEVLLDNMDFKVTRVGGADRFQTANLVATKFWPKGSDVVVIAPSSYEPLPEEPTLEDVAVSNGVVALVAAPLAHSYGAPLLLTMPDQIPEETQETIKKLGATKAIVVGQLPEESKVLETLAGMGLEVEQLAGETIFETSLVVAQQLKEKLHFRAVAIINVEDPGASNGAALTALKEGVVLPIKEDEVPDEIAKFLSDHKFKLRWIIFTGTIPLPTKQRVVDLVKPPGEWAKAGT